MIVYLESPRGSRTEDYLDRAKLEVERVVGFRGSVVSAKVQDSQIAVRVKINADWDMPVEQKPEYLANWIRAKVRQVFAVKSISVRG
jgi:hypothetical protein